MFKRFFTFGSVVVFIFLIFVIFFFESISYLGGFGQALRVGVIVYSALHFSFVVRNIIIDKREKEESNLADVVVKRVIEEREKRKNKNLMKRGFIS
jgi:hypothetical protein